MAAEHCVRRSGRRRAADAGAPSTTRLRILRTGGMPVCLPAAFADIRLAAALAPCANQRDDNAGRLDRVDHLFGCVPADIRPAAAGDQAVR